MARKRKILPEINNVEITGIAAEGKALTKVRLKEDDESPIVVFVPYGAPGDVVNLKIDKKKHNFAEAHITEIVSPSPVRVTPFCSYFGTCGGCKWQHLPYEEQLKFKRQQVIDALQRLGKIDFPDVNPVLGSKNNTAYRNKMEYTFSQKRWKSWEEMKGGESECLREEALGFHIPGAFDKVLHIEECLLQSEIGDRIRNFIYEYAINHSLTFYDIRANSGLLRNLMIRITSTGEIMVCVVFGEDKQEEILKLLESLASAFPQITDLEYVVNLKLNDSIADLEVRNYKGPGYIGETMGDLKFRISPKSFYQTNSEQAFVLYKTVAKFAGLSNKDSGLKPLVYDLYTGAGTIANFVSKNASKVIGIEYVEDAVKDARINSRINNIQNTEFFAGDMKKVLTDSFIATNGKPDIIIVDPPRAGMHEDVVKTILNALPGVIVYVSCNPATQARDLALLDEKYEVTEVQPVDMFPHTHHVENVVKLIRREK